MKPTVKHLCVFGCDAFMHIPRDERHKLDSKCRKCILLGYGEQTKGYRLYDPEKKTVLYSRDVKMKRTEKLKKAPTPMAVTIIVRGSREVLLVPSLLRASTDALILQF